MKNLDRGKHSVPLQAIVASRRADLLQALESFQKDNQLLQDEKEALVEEARQERTEKLSFMERLEQAIRDLGIAQDEQQQIASIRDQAIDERDQAIQVRDRAIASRLSMSGRLGGLTAHNNRLSRKVETLIAEAASLRKLNKTAVEQVVAANQTREAFQAAYQRVKTAYQTLKAKYQTSQAVNEKLKSERERLTVGYKKLKTKYNQERGRIAAAYQEMSLVDRQQLPSTLKQLLDQIENNYRD